MLEIVGQSQDSVGHPLAHLFLQHVWNRAIRIHVAEEVNLKTTFVSLPRVLRNVIGGNHIFANLSGSGSLDRFAAFARMHQNVKALLISGSIEASDYASV